LTEGQRIWLDERVNRMPVNPRVFDSPEGRSREDLRKSYERTMISRSIEFDDSRALSIEEVLQNYFKSSLIDSNEELRRAWIELNKAKKEGRISEEKFNSLLDQMLELKFRDPITGKEVYLTEEYARELNQRIKEDRELLELLKREWRESSRRRYLKVLEELGLG
ncbi:ABC transporter substrate-binding protein, partial [Thermococci archaeon]